MLTLTALTETQTSHNMRTFRLDEPEYKLGIVSYNYLYTELGLCQLDMIIGIPYIIIYILNVILRFFIYVTFIQTNSHTFE